MPRLRGFQDVSDRSASISEVTNANQERSVFISMPSAGWETGAGGGAGGLSFSRASPSRAESMRLLAARSRTWAQRTACVLTKGEGEG